MLSSLFWPLAVDPVSSIPKLAQVVSIYIQLWLARSTEANLFLPLINFP
jgi:hypothetical protein